MRFLKNVSLKAKLMILIGSLLTVIFILTLSPIFQSWNTSQNFKVIDREISLAKKSRRQYMNCKKSGD